MRRRRTPKGCTRRRHCRAGADLAIHDSVFPATVLDVPITPRIFDAPYWGATTFEAHRERCRRGIFLRVYVDGADVTSRCRFFDDTPGHAYAVLYRLSADGRHIERDASARWPALEVVRAFLVREGAPFELPS